MLNITVQSQKKYCLFEKTRCSFDGVEGRGVRSHTGITALFMRIFGRVAKVKDQNNKIIYLNRKSLERWLNRHHVQREKKPNWEQLISKVIENQVKEPSSVIEEQTEAMTETVRGIHTSDLDVTEPSSEAISESFDMGYDSVLSDMIRRAGHDVSEGENDSESVASPPRAEVDMIIDSLVEGAETMGIHQIRDVREYMHYRGSIFPKQLLGTRSLMWWKQNETFGSREQALQFEASFNRMMGNEEINQYAFEYDVRAEGDCGAFSVVILMMIAAQQKNYSIPENRPEIIQQIAEIAVYPGETYFKADMVQKGARILMQAFEDENPMDTLSRLMMDRSNFNRVALCIRELMYRYLDSPFAPEEFIKDEHMNCLIGEGDEEIDLAKDGRAKPYLSAGVLLDFLQRYNMDVPLYRSEVDQDPTLHAVEIPEVQEVQGAAVLFGHNHFMILSHQ